MILRSALGFFSYFHFFPPFSYHPLFLSPSRGVFGLPLLFSQRSREGFLYHRLFFPKQQFYVRTSFPFVSDELSYTPLLFLFSFPPFPDLWSIPTACAFSPFEIIQAPLCFSLLKVFCFAPPSVLS